MFPLVKLKSQKMTHPNTQYSTVCLESSFEP